LPHGAGIGHRQRSFQELAASQGRLRGSFQLGPSYREVIPLLVVLLAVALLPQLEAVEELE